MIFVSGLTSVLLTEFVTESSFCVKELQHVSSFLQALAPATSTELRAQRLPQLWLHVDTEHFISVIIILL